MTPACRLDFRTTTDKDGDRHTVGQGRGLTMTLRGGMTKTSERSPRRASVSTMTRTQWEGLSISEACRGGHWPDEKPPWKGRLKQYALLGRYRTFRFSCGFPCREAH